MTYTQTTLATLRSKAGSLLQKLYAEFGLVKTEIDSNVKVARVALAGGNANAFAFAWANPETSKIIVTRVVVDVTTKSASAGSLLDVGPGATATTHSDTLIDGLDIATAVITADNITNKGGNGKSLCKLDAVGGTTAYITGQILVQNAAALAGYAYIFYHKVS
jgi:hypothetical protein